MTPAEAEVAARVAAGETNDLIARDRRVSPSTVKSQLRRIYVAAQSPGRSQFIARILLRALTFAAREIARLRDERRAD